MKPVAITMGDPNGVGPEILIRSFASLPKDVPFVVYGDGEILTHANDQFSTRLKLNLIQVPGQAETGVLNIISPAIYSSAELKPGILSAEAGHASLEYIRRATTDAASGTLSAIATLPVNKEAIRLTNPDFTGHTGYIARLLGNPAHGMLLASDGLCVSHVSTHCSLLEAIGRVKKNRIEEVIRLTWKTLSSLGHIKGELAVAGLNPHAGEGGAFGREEIEEIAPAIESMQAEGIPVVGPVPPDTVFHSALKGSFCGVVCMYHDQGHIPMKTIDFDGGVNITMGLPVVRTSVDHGTAFDIAWQGLASLKSFTLAVEHAMQLSENR